MTDLIKREDALQVINALLIEDESYKKWLRIDIKNIEPVEAIPIDWIRQWMKEYDRSVQFYVSIMILAWVKKECI
jgi:hypothetical protein